MIHGHGGNIYFVAEQLGCLPSDIIDMSSNVNPIGPPNGLLDFLKDKISAICALPEVDAQKMVKAVSKWYQIPPNQLLAGNGTTQFIYLAPLALKSKKALIVAPTYADYADAFRMHSVCYDFFFCHESQNFFPDLNQLDKVIKNYDTLVICNPNNPTGCLILPEDIEALCKNHPMVRFIIDESYLPFVPNYLQYSMIHRQISNVMVLNSMSKIFKIPGLRIGFLIASDALIQLFVPYMLPWSVNSLAQEAVIYLMEDHIGTDRFIDSTAKYLASEREKLMNFFQRSTNIQLYPSVTSFILIKLYHHFSNEIAEALVQKKILVRNCANFIGLSDRFIRISLKSSDVNSMVASELNNLL